MTFLYSAYYCEENIWHLCQHAQFALYDKRVVFISNAQQNCPFWFQRAARIPNEPVYWDYHVILLYFNESWKVWDLDTLLPLPMPFDEYLEQTFHHRRQSTDEPLDLPLFKVVPAAQFVREFTSDRSHMKDEHGRWLQAPPPWPPILAGSANNLHRFIDMTDTAFGTIMKLDELQF
jgi:protein N-terminal glutamine amidohydrolase